MILSNLLEKLVGHLAESGTGEGKLDVLRTLRVEDPKRINDPQGLHELVSGLGLPTGTMTKAESFLFQEQTKALKAASDSKKAAETQSSKNSK